MAINKILILILTYLFCSMSNANAYLDPGTGNIILQAILAFIAGAAATVSLWWMNLKYLLKSKSMIENTNDSDESSF